MVTILTLHYKDGATFNESKLVDDLNAECARILWEHLRDEQIALVDEDRDLEVSRRLDLDAFPEPLHDRRRSTGEVHFKSEIMVSRVRHIKGTVPNIDICYRLLKRINKRATGEGVRKCRTK